MPVEVTNWLSATGALLTAPFVPYLLAGVAVLLGLWRRRTTIKARARRAFAFVRGSAEGAALPKLGVTHALLLLAVLSWAAQRDWKLPFRLPSLPTIVAPANPATSVTYVYEKDSTAIPTGVLAALNKLNRDRKIIATPFEADTKDGDGNVPDQYKVALAAGQTAGLPALVVTAGDVVLKVVKDPTTEAHVMEAAQ